MELTKKDGNELSPDRFVHELVRRVDQAYPVTLASITKALASVSGGYPELIGAMRNPLTRSGFLLGCAAEEIVSVSSYLEGKTERAFIRDVVNELRLFARPLPVKRIGPDLRRLLSDFKEHPNRMRVRSVRYMLQLNNLENLAEKLESSGTCALAIECTVVTDEVAGVLWDQWTGKAGKNARRLYRRHYPARTFEQSAV